MSINTMNCNGISGFRAVSQNTTARVAESYKIERASQRDRTISELPSWLPHCSPLPPSLLAADTPPRLRQPPTKKRQPPPPRWQVPENREADDTARFLAGMPGNPGSPFADLEKSDAWKDHRSRLDSAWHRAEGSLIAGLHEFGKAELSDPALRQAIVYYPFSGPDALYATASFPNNTTYVLVALEPSGTLPTLAKLSQKQDLAGYLAATRETMASVLGRSFFITREMDHQFRGQVTDGLLLPILEVLVRQPQYHSGIPLYAPGRRRQTDRSRPQLQAAHAIRRQGIADCLSFRRRPVGAPDVLPDHQPGRRASQDEPGSSSSTRRVERVGHAAQGDIVYDASGRVLHHSRPDPDNSQAVLQDDSGIPFHFFTPDVWKVQLFGEYTRPYGSFRYLIQNDLQKAYQDPSARPLPFRIGYGYGKVKSNLQLARRTAPSAAPSQPAQ